MIPSAVSEDDAEDGDDSSGEEEPFVPRPTAFALMNNDDDDDESEESDIERENDENVDGYESGSAYGQQDSAGILRQENRPGPEQDDKKPAAANDNNDEEVDLDALLDEFREKDINPRANDSGGNLAGHESSAQQQQQLACPFDFILDSFDSRDLDYEHSMRASLLKNLDDGGNEKASRKTSTRSKAPLFGHTRDGWIRPPRLVGGGLGMTTYDRDPRILPWPYRTVESGTLPLLSQWCTLVHSDSYRRDCEDFTRVIRQSGDLNALVMFVAHHPYVTTALLQLTTVLYQTNHSQQGLELLQRCLWIYESSALVSFVQNLQQSQTQKRTYLMDYDQPENQPFFDALFQLIHVSSIAGYVTSCRLVIIAYIIVYLS